PHLAANRDARAAGSYLALHLVLGMCSMVWSDDHVLLRDERRKYHICDRSVSHPHQGHRYRILRISRGKSWFRGVPNSYSPSSECLGLAVGIYPNGRAFINPVWIVHS